MKPKNFQKKMLLNKKTVANLNEGEMKHLAGGTYPTGITCTICDTNLSCAAEKCIYDFTNDGNTCTGLPTQTREITCP